MRLKKNVHLKSTLLFFWCLNFGLGNCTENHADQVDFFEINLPGIRSGEITLKREVSGYVLSNGNGLEDVGIYEANNLLAVTNGQGFYKALLNLGFIYTLTPQKTGYQFTPPSLVIPGNEYSFSNQNFSAQKLPTVTITGKVIWKNYGCSIMTIPNNPLSLVALEAYSDDGSLFCRVVTGSDGEYSISVPVGWKGWIKPFRLGFNFFPEKIIYDPVNEDKTHDYEAPGPGDAYWIKVVIKIPEDMNPKPIHDFFIKLNGIEHAQGCTYAKNTGTGLSRECYFSIPSGWMGDIIPDYGWPDFDLNYDPQFYRIDDPLISDMEFTFTVHPK